MTSEMLFLLCLSLLGVLHQPHSVQAEDNLPRAPNCGYSNVTHTRIVGGEPAKLGAWPWMATLGYQLIPKWRCGGSLITSRHILTAAHCMHRALYVVRVGDLNLDRTDDGAHPVESGIEKITIHPSYARSAHASDIAVLKLEKEIPFSANIRPICLPLDEPLRSQDFVGREAFVAGWGATGYMGPTTPELREVQVPVITSASCRKDYSMYSNAAIDDRVICAGYAAGGKDACQGDSGGPLMVPENQFTYYEIGVVSWGHGCALPGFPGIYTRVTKFLDFIIEATK